MKSCRQRFWPYLQDSWPGTFIALIACWNLALIWECPTRAMSLGLFELRLKSREGIGRVFYCTMVNRKIVMLHQFVKKTDKTPPKELALARKRIKEWKDVDA